MESKRRQRRHSGMADPRTAPPHRGQHHTTREVRGRKGARRRNAGGAAPVKRVAKGERREVEEGMTRGVDEVGAVEEHAIGGKGGGTEGARAGGLTGSPSGDDGGGFGDGARGRHNPTKSARGTPDGTVGEEAAWPTAAGRLQEGKCKPSAPAQTRSEAASLLGAGGRCRGRRHRLASRPRLRGPEHL
eukprot:1461517-Rhodomonas_salina.2